MGCAQAIAQACFRPIKRKWNYTAWRTIHPPTIQFAGGAVLALPHCGFSFPTFVPLSVCHLVSVKWNLRGETANKSETASEGEEGREKDSARGTVEQWEVDRGQWDRAGLSCSDDVSFANVTLSLPSSLSLSLCA